MKPTFETYDLPAHWASYLINGDCSGLEPEDIELCDTKTKDLGSCVDVSEDTFFGQFNGLGCDLATYTFRLDEVGQFYKEAKERYSEVLKKLND